MRTTSLPVTTTCITLLEHSFFLPCHMEQSYTDEPNPTLPSPPLPLSLTSSPLPLTCTRVGEVFMRRQALRGQRSHAAMHRQGHGLVWHQAVDTSRTQITCTHIHIHVCATVDTACTRRMCLITSLPGACDTHTCTCTLYTHVYNVCLGVCFHMECETP